MNAAERRDADIHNNPQLCKNPRISIIVPIYHCESFLPKCLDSLTNQTYPNIEIILVDDGSTDCSADICDSYAARDSRIVVLHKQNGGVSSARNAGLAVATGEYITFVDADDWVAPDACEKMIGKIEDGKLLYVWKYNTTVDGMVQILPDISQEHSIGEFAADVIESRQHICIRAVCGKLYDRRLLDGVLFPESIYI